MTSPAHMSIERSIAAPPEVVFDAWLDPEALRRFMCPAEGTSVARAEVDAKQGGRFLVVMKVAGQELPHSGEYLEIVRPERLVFTWISAAAGTGSRVSLRFEPLAGGHTRLTLEHTDLPSAEARARHESGWSHILGELSRAL